jgi:hypothetical protein
MRRLVFFAFFAAIYTAAAQPGDPSGRVIYDIPEALRLIRIADEVYVFPVMLVKKRVAHDGSSITPRGDYKRLRRLDAEASRALKRLLGKESSWMHAVDNTLEVDAPSRSVGFIFRKGKDRLVLLRSLGARLEGTFNDQHTSGSLEFDKADPELDKWIRQFAKPELGIK